MKLIKKLLSLICTCFLIVGCQPKESADNQITIGTSPGPYSQLFLDAVKPILEKQGYHIKQIDFSDLMQADIALQQGNIDINVDQHTAYMKDFNQNKKADLVSLTHIPTVPTAIYSSIHPNLQGLTTGSKIAVPNDPSNAARAYRLLAKAGWITMKPINNTSIVSKNDIQTNPHQLDIVEMDSANIPRTLNDFDYSVIPGSRAYAAKLDSKQAFMNEDIIPEYELIVAVKAQNASKPWAKAIVDAYDSDEFKQYIKQHNSENYWYLPNNKN